MKKPSFSYLHPLPCHSSSASISEQDVIVPVVRDPAVYEVRRFRAARDFLALSVHLSAGFAVIREIVL
jgi:hypothetical protein